MAALSATEITSPSATLPIITLGASDTITFDRRKKQLFLVRNGTGSSVTLKVDGDGGTSVQKPGVGSVTVSGGYDTVIANGAAAYVDFGKISDYCQGVVTLSGASGCTAHFINI